MEIIAEIIGYGVARLLLPVISFGWVRVAPLREPLNLKFKWGIARTENGVRLVDPDISGFVGFMLLLFGAIGGTMVYRALS